MASALRVQVAQPLKGRRWFAVAIVLDHTCEMEDRDLTAEPRGA